MDAKSLDAIQAKLQQANEEKATAQEITTLQQEESVSISGSNARLMIMKKLSRKSEVCVREKRGVCVCVCVRKWGGGECVCERGEGECV